MPGLVRIAVGLASFALLAAPARAAEIAYVSGGAIWASGADGSGRRLLVAPPAGRSLGEPAWSPDGTRLVYVSSPRSDEEQAQLMLFDGLASRPLTPVRAGSVDQSPVWSPDGTTVAFAHATVHGDSIRTSIVTHLVATGAERTLVTRRLDLRLRSVGEPAWSPDGALVAFTESALDRRAYFRPRIRVVGAPGGAARTLLRDAQSAAWSPDGTRLAFASVRDKRGTRCGSDECGYAGELYTAAAGGTGLRRLTRGEGDEEEPAWAPDGSRILFSSDRNLPDGDSGEVYSIAADGSCLTWLTNGTPASGSPAWRPGGGGFAPGSCDPAAHPVADAAAPPPRAAGELWLGPAFRGLLFTRAQRDGRARTLYYDDCERFDPGACPDALTLTGEPACRPFSLRGLASNAYRFRRVRGALLAYYGREAPGRLLSGDAVTSVSLSHGNSLSALRRTIAGLRPVGAAAPPPRLAPPRIPRAFARRLEAAGPSRLRTALRAFGPYRIAAC